MTDHMAKLFEPYEAIYKNEKLPKRHEKRLIVRANFCHTNLQNMAKLYQICYGNIFVVRFGLMASGDDDLF